MKTKLSDIYSKSVAGKGEIYHAEVSSAQSYLPTKERDPKSVKLEEDISKKMDTSLKAAIPEAQRKAPLPPLGKVREVGFEEALKELSGLLKPGDNKS